MKTVPVYVGSLACGTIHMMRVQMRFPYDPAKLQAEIKLYATAGGVSQNRYLAREARVFPVTDARTPNLFEITFAHLEAKAEIEAILDEIDHAVAEAKEIVRLLDLTVCDSEGAGPCGKR